MSLAMCPHCDLPMKLEGKSKWVPATQYWCPNCGKNYTKIKGEKGYHKGQIVNLPQATIMRYLK